MHLLALSLATAAACAPTRVDTPRSFEPVRRFSAAEARQGIAVDATHVYAVDSRRIGKYDKLAGARLGGWDAGDDASITHLNSGVVVDGRLYCAHSNYPGVPMVSSIEIFDTQTLAHIDSHPLIDAPGSATWIDRFEGAWWVAFANYEGRGGQPGRGPEATTLVRYDDSWRPQESYTFPPQVVDRFGSRSNSGGSWKNGLLYATGHDAAEIYVVRLPAHGSELRLVEIIAAPIEGQGIAWDRTAGTLLFGIAKRTREVVLMSARQWG
jgi:hypothetical protein